MNTKIKIAAANFMCNAMILLDNYDDLASSNIWSKDIKYYGNRFIKSISKVTEPIEKSLHNDEAEIKQIHAYSNILEEITSHIANADLETMTQLLCFVRDQKSGNVLVVDDSEMLMKLRDEKSLNTRQ